MKDTLASAKSIHHLLIVISAIIFIVGYNMKVIEDPYEHALYEIKKAETTLISLAKANKIRFLYTDGFWVIKEKTLMKMEDQSRKSQLRIDSLKNHLSEAIAEGEGIKTKGKQTLKLARTNLRESKAIANKARMKGNILLADSIENIWIPDQLTGIREIYEVLNQKDVTIPEMSNLSPHEKFEKTYKPDSVRLIELTAQAEDSDTAMFDHILDEYPEFIRLVVDNSNTPINDVKKLLKAKSEELKQNKQSEIELLGLKVNVSNSHIIAPVVCIALELYLISLLLHVFTLLHTASGSAIVREYPLMFLFRDYFSIIISVASLMFSFVATEQVLSKTMISNWWEWTYAALHTILTLSIMILSFAIRTKAHESSDISGI